MIRKNKKKPPAFQRRPVVLVQAGNAPVPFIDAIDRAAGEMTKVRSLTLDTPVDGIYMAAIRKTPDGLRMIEQGTLTFVEDRETTLICLIGCLINAMVCEGVSREDLAERLLRDVYRVPGRRKP